MSNSPLEERLAFLEKRVMELEQRLDEDDETFTVLLDGSKLSEAAFQALLISLVDQGNLCPDRFDMHLSRAVSCLRARGDSTAADRLEECAEGYNGLLIPNEFVPPRA